MQSTSRISFFEYWDESPSDWERLLRDQVALGVSQLSIPILWGIHESAPGIRDFSKQSKLRIEKLLTLAQNVGLSVRLVLGFPAHPQVFPNWAMQEIHREIVPKILWEGEPPYFSVISVPSPKATKIKEGFISFFEEVSAIVSLYLSPGGPIIDAQLFLDPLELSQSISGELGYSKFLERRYPDIDVFNKRFQTHYKNLQAVATPSGAKLIESKRPWLFAYDYRWSRAQWVREYYNELLQSRIPENLKKIIKPKSSGSNESSGHSYKIGVCFESTLIQFENNKVMGPFIVEGLLSSSSVQAFQWANIVQESLEKSRVEFVPLPILPGDTLPNYSALTVMCGKYIPQEACQYLRRQLEQGAQLFFPMGLPQYDENLESLQFFLGGGKTVIELGGFEWFRISKETGSLFYPTQTVSTGSIEGIRSWLREFDQLSQGAN